MANRFNPNVISFDPRYFQLVQDSLGNPFYQDRFSGALYPAQSPMPYHPGFVQMGYPPHSGYPHMQYVVPVASYPAPAMPPRPQLTRTYQVPTQEFTPSSQPIKTANKPEQPTSLPIQADAAPVVQEITIDTDELVDQVISQTLDDVIELTITQTADELDQQNQWMDEAVEQTAAIILPETVDEVVAQAIAAAVIEDQKIDQLVDQALTQMLEVEMNDLISAALNWTLAKQSGIYIGQWHNDKPHGLGAFTYENNQKLTGYWKEGVLDISQSASLSLPDYDNAVFKGKLILRKGGTYQPAPRQLAVVQWSDGKCFSGYFNGQSQPESTQAFNLANGYQYRGSVNSQYELQDATGVLTKTEATDWCLTGKFHKGRLVEVTSLQVDKDATYQGAVHDHYQPHGQGILTKQWNGLTLVFKGIFNSGQWQSNQPVMIGKLGSFIGQPGDEVSPNPSEIIFANGAKAEQVSFALNEIRITNMIMNKGAAQLTYSGLVDGQGYPVGEGTIQIHWNETLLDRPSDYAITGHFSAENVTTKKQRYMLITADKTYESVTVKDFWLSVEAPRIKESKQPPSATEATSSVTALLAQEPAKEPIKTISASTPQQLPVLSTRKKAAELSTHDQSVLDFVLSSELTHAPSVASMADENKLLETEGFFSQRIYFDQNPVRAEAADLDVIICWRNEEDIRRRSLSCWVLAEQRLQMAQSFVSLAAKRTGRQVTMPIPQEVISWRWRFLPNYLNVSCSEPIHLERIMGKPVRLVGCVPAARITPIRIPGRLQYAVEQPGEASSVEGVLEFGLPNVLESLPQEMLDIRRQLLEKLGCAFDLVAQPTEQGHSVQILDAESNIGECFFRESSQKRTIEDYYFFGQPQWRPLGFGVLVYASGDIEIGRFGAPVDQQQMQPNLIDGCMLWRMEHVITLNEPAKPGCSWMRGLVPVDIYQKSKSVKGSEASARAQLVGLSQPLVAAVLGQKISGRPFVERIAGCWSDYASFSGPIQCMKIAAVCLNSEEHVPLKLGKISCPQQAEMMRALSQLRFSKEMHLRVLMPGLQSTVKSVLVRAGDVMFRGDMHFGRAVKGELIKIKQNGKQQIQFEGEVEPSGSLGKGKHLKGGEKTETFSGVTFFAL